MSSPSAATAAAAAASTPDASLMSEMLGSFEADMRAASEQRARNAKDSADAATPASAVDGDSFRGLLDPAWCGPGSEGLASPVADGGVPPATPGTPYTPKPLRELMLEDEERRRQSESPQEPAATATAAAVTPPPADVEPAAEEEAREAEEEVVSPPSPPPPPQFAALYAALNGLGSGSAVSRGSLFDSVRQNWGTTAAATPAAASSSSFSSRAPASAAEAGEDEPKTERLEEAAAALLAECTQQAFALSAGRRAARAAAAAAAAASPSSPTTPGTPGPAGSQAPSLFKNEVAEANAEFLACELGMKRRARPLREKRRAHPEEVVGPDGYNYIGNMPSPGAVATLRVLWSMGPKPEGSATGPFDAVDPFSGYYNDAAPGGVSIPIQTTREILTAFDRSLRMNTTEAAKPLPGDELCESPTASATLFLDEKIRVAEAKIRSGKARQAALLQDGQAQDGGGGGTVKAREWHQQELLAEEWRVKQAEEELQQLRLSRGGDDGSASSDAAGGGGGGGGSCERLRSNSLSDAPPDTLRVTGPNATVNGKYYKHLGRENTYVRHGGMTLFHDGHKWGIASTPQRSPVIISLRTKARNPCAVWQWYEADPRQGIYVANKRIELAPEVESVVDNTQTLLAMGFPETAVRSSLASTGGSLEGALDLLVQAGWTPTAGSGSLPTSPQDALLTPRPSSKGSSLGGRTTSTASLRRAASLAAATRLTVPLDLTSPTESSESLTSMSSNLSVPQFGRLVPDEILAPCAATGSSGSGSAGGGAAAAAPPAAAAPATPATPAQSQLGGFSVTRVASNVSTRVSAEEPSASASASAAVALPAAAASVASASASASTPSAATLELVRVMRERYPSVDAQVVSDVVVQGGDNPEECAAVLAQMEGAEVAPEATAEAAATAAAATTGSRGRGGGDRRLPQYRVLPTCGISYRVAPDMDAIERRIAGPRRGDVVSVRAIVGGNFLQLESGYHLPITKEGRQLVERVDLQKEGEARRLGQEAVDIAADPAELCCALRNGRVRLAALLLDAGCPTDQPDATDGTLPLALMERHPAFNDASEAALTVVKHLAGGPALAARDELGRTPVHRAAAAGKASLVLAYLQCGADVGAADEAGRTPLSLAMAVQRVEGNDYGLWKRVLRELATPATLEALDRSGKSVLHHTLRAGKTGMANLLLEYGASTSSRDSEGRTPLITALDSPAFTKQPKAKEVVQRLAASRSVRDEVDAASGATPLCCAAAGTNLELVRCLLDEGADPSVPDAAGASALVHAARNNAWTETSVSLFLKLAADAASSEAALDCLLGDPRRASLAEALVGHHPGLNAGRGVRAAARQDVSGLDAAVAARWLAVLRAAAAGAAGQAQDVVGDTALHVAAAHGSDDVVMCLAAACPGAAAVQNAQGETPLHLAAARASAMGAEAVLSLLTDDAKVQVDAQGRTALHRAVRAEGWEVAKELLEAGFSPDVQDADGKYPYQHVAEDRRKQGKVLGPPGAPADTASTVIRMLATPHVMVHVMFE